MEQFDANFRPRDETLNDTELLPEQLPEALFLAWDASVLQNCFASELSFFSHETLSDTELLPEPLPEALFLAWDASVLQNCFDPELFIFLAFLAGAG